MYKSTPVTKKANSAVKYNSALKQTLLDTNAQMLKDSKKKPFEIITKTDKKGTEGTPDEIIKTKKDYVGAANDACSSEYIAKNGNAACEEYKGLSDEVKDAANYDTTIKKGTEGTPDETNYSATEIFRKDFGTNVGDPENREMNRVIKKAGKDVRRGEAKKARIENKKAKFEAKRGKDIKAGEKGYRKQQRLKAKGTETTKELGGFQDRMDNALAGQASGKGLDQTYRRADVAKTAADFDDDVQVAQDKLRQDMAKSTQTDSERYADKLKNIGQDMFKLTSADTSVGDSFINKYGSGIFMKKSPMKKNYFKK